MKTPTLATVTTFAGSVVIGFGAALAIASAAAVSHAAPSLRAPAPVEIIRLEPVVVTVSKATYDAIRHEGTRLARSTEARKVTRG